MILGGNPAFLNLKVTGFPISKRTRNSANAVVFLKSFLYRKEHSPDQNHAGKTVGKMTYSIKRLISDL